MTPTDGGPAFPYAERLPSGNIDTLQQYSGLSIRDWFAGMALQGIRASTTGERYPKEMTAKLAYADADAMLQQREAP